MSEESDGCWAGEMSEESDGCLAGEKRVTSEESDEE